MAETKTKTAPKPATATAGEKRLAAKAQELETRIDRLERTVGELVAGNSFNAREAWS